MTEPCDATAGGATWLDQAQETAARANQSAGPHRRQGWGEEGGKRGTGANREWEERIVVRSRNVQGGRGCARRGQPEPV